MISEETIDLLRDYILAELLHKTDTEILPDTALVEGGLVDSLGIFKLIAFIEERFNMRVDPQDVVLENFATLNAMQQMIQRK